MVFLLFFLISLAFIQPSWAQDIRDIKPPVELPPNHVLFYSLGFLLASIALAVLARYFLKRKPPKPINLPRKTPRQIAEERLNDLKKQNLPGRGLVKEYYTALSDIVRRYIEDRFDIRAPEMTTQEFLWCLNDSAELDDRQKTILKDFLNACDMVKFAKYRSSPAEMEQSFIFAKSLIDETHSLAT